MLFGSTQTTHKRRRRRSGGGGRSRTRNRSVSNKTKVRSLASHPPFRPITKLIFKWVNRNYHTTFMPLLRDRIIAFDVRRLGKCFHWMSMTTDAPIQVVDPIHRSAQDNGRIQWLPSYFVNAITIGIYWNNSYGWFGTAKMVPALLWIFWKVPRFGGFSLYSGFGPIAKVICQSFANMCAFGWYRYSAFWAHCALCANDSLLSMPIVNRWTKTGTNGKTQFRLSRRPERETETCWHDFVSWKQRQHRWKLIHFFWLALILINGANRLSNRHHITHSHRPTPPDPAATTRRPKDDLSQSSHAFQTQTEFKFGCRPKLLPKKLNWNESHKIKWCVAGVDWKICPFACWNVYISVWYKFMVKKTIWWNENNRLSLTGIKVTKTKQRKNETKRISNTKTNTMIKMMKMTVEREPTTTRQ